MEEKKIRTYIAAMDTPYTVGYAMEHGITTYPGANFVPLSKNIDTAVIRFLGDCRRNNQSPGDIFIVFVVDIPEDVELSEIYDTEYDVVYLSHKGVVPPEYIVDVVQAELSLQ